MNLQIKPEIGMDTHRNMMWMWEIYKVSWQIWMVGSTPDHDVLDGWKHKQII